MPQRKILATMGIGRHQALLDVTLPSFERFAALHGYEVRYPDTDPAPERGEGPWGKIAFINTLLPTCDVLFWIDADDLSSQVTIGITCVLAAIAFQLAEAAALPAVDYLTLADRVYAICYVAIGLAVLETRDDPYRCLMKVLGQICHRGVLPQVALAGYPRRRVAVQVIT